MTEAILCLLFPPHTSTRHVRKTALRYAPLSLVSYNCVVGLRATMGGCCCSGPRCVPPPLPFSFREKMKKWNECLSCHPPFHRNPPAPPLTHNSSSFLLSTASPQNAQDPGPETRAAAGQAPDARAEAAARRAPGVRRHQRLGVFLRRSERARDERRDTRDAARAGGHPHPALLHPPGRARAGQYRRGFEPGQRR